MGGFALAIVLFLIGAALALAAFGGAMTDGPDPAWAMPVFFGGAIVAAFAVVLFVVSAARIVIPLVKGFF